MPSSPPRGSLGYLQLPATDLATSAAFYERVFGWDVDAGSGSFEAPGLIGQLTTDIGVAGAAGPLLWLCADDLWVTLGRAEGAGGRVVEKPVLDGGERWLATVEDPAGNRVGVVVPAYAPRSQVLLAVQDVEASSRWYQQLLGLVSDHGGTEYERLLADGTLVLQLHAREVEHHHGPVATSEGPVGNGVLVWFGDVTDLDGVAARAAGLGATVVRPVHRNPPEGQGNGPSHRELWVQDPDGYTVVVAGPDGEVFEL